jgi:predicted MFS family arabinose efflux permease
MASSSDGQGAASGHPSIAIIMLALIPFSLGYFLSYLYRAVNAVVAPDLMRDFKLSAGELGLLTAAYLLAFALFQLPLGILLDRFGPRRVQAALVAIGGAGALLFVYAPSFYVLAGARAIIGLGFAGGLMSGFKAVVLWVPEQRRALANSCVMSIGALGLLVSTAPTEWAVQTYGWRNALLGVVAFTGLVAAMIYLIVPERRQSGVPAPLKDQLRDVGLIYRDRVFLALAPLLATTAGAQIAVQTLWAGPWLRDVAGLDRTGVANVLFVSAAGFFVGILISGAVADWLGRRGVSLITVMLGFLSVFFLVQIAIIAGVPGLDAVLWSLFGMCGQVAVLAYPWLSSYFGVKLSGRSNTAANLLMFLCAFLMQYAIGLVLDLWPRTAAGGYPTEAYSVALGGTLAVQVVAYLWYLLNRPRVLAAEAAMRARSA